MERLTKPRYIVWQEALEQGEPIIDEQYRGVVAIINFMHYFIQQSYGLGNLMAAVNVFKSYLNFHFKTEEGFCKIFA